jgi:hypothetical protein
MKRQASEDWFGQIVDISFENSSWQGLRIGSLILTFSQEEKELFLFLLFLRSFSEVRMEEDQGEGWSKCLALQSRTGS